METDTANREMTKWETDYRGKTVAVLHHLTVTDVTSVAAHLRPYLQPAGPNFTVLGFVLGVVISCPSSTAFPYIIRLPNSLEGVEVASQNVLKLLLDDEAEPDMIDSFPRLI